MIVGKILESSKYTFGFNAQTAEYGDLVAEGVIDPAKVVRCALQDAASVAGLLITTEAMIAEIPKKDTGQAHCQWAGGAWTTKSISHFENKSPGFRQGFFAAITFC